MPYRSEYNPYDREDDYDPLAELTGTAPGHPDPATLSFQERARASTGNQSSFPTAVRLTGWIATPKRRVCKWARPERAARIWHPERVARIWHLARDMPPR